MELIVIDGELMTNFFEKLKYNRQTNASNND